MPALPDPCAIILAGGQSSRMGRDKGLLQIDGAPLITLVANAAAQVCPHLLLVTRNPAHASFGMAMVTDEQPGQGPAGGILAGLRHSSSDLNLVLSCDIPFIHPDLLRLLLDRSPGHAVTIAQSRGQAHPLIGVYRRECEAAFEAALAAGERKLRKIISGLDVCVVDLDQEMPLHEPRWLLNLNTPEDWAGIQQESR